MLAVCSDLDETPDDGVYLEIARFLNSTEATAMGPGVGLEVGNTIYFDMPPGQFSYWGTGDRGRAMARALMRSGHIDAIHSWGDLATGRRHAERNLAELERNACRLEVWIDHSRAASNFGPDLMTGSGDVRGADAYHADLTLAYGVRHVWRGRTTSLAGRQERSQRRRRARRDHGRADRQQEQRSHAREERRFVALRGGAAGEGLNEARSDGGFRRHSSPPPTAPSGERVQKLAPSGHLPVEHAPLRRKGLRAVKSPSFTARFFHLIERTAGRLACAGRPRHGERKHVPVTATAPQMRLLIIEDDRESADYLVKAFREVGHVADLASDGEEGLSMADGGDYDVLVVDRMLPKRDGLSVIGRCARRATARRS